MNLLSRYLRGESSFIKNKDNGVIKLKFQKSSIPKNSTSHFTLKDKSMLFLSNETKDKVKLLRGVEQKSVILTPDLNLHISTQDKNSNKKIIDFTFKNNKLTITSVKDNDITNSIKSQTIPINPDVTPEIEYTKTITTPGTSSTSTKILYDPLTGKTKHEITTDKTPLYTTKTYKSDEIYDNITKYKNGGKTSIYTIKNDAGTKTTYYTTVDGVSTKIKESNNGNGETTIYYKNGHPKKYIRTSRNYQSETNYNEEGKFKHKLVTIKNPDGTKIETFVDKEDTIISPRDEDGNPMYYMRLNENGSPTIVKP